MDRRRFLRVAAAASLLGIAGCNTTTSNPTTDPATTLTPTQTATRRPTESPTETTQASLNTIFVAPDGSNSNRGTQAAPVGSIQEALGRARPGQTIYVKPGQYFESLKTVRSGTQPNPITITGPPDAVVSGKKERKYSRGLTIRHSHIHLTGLTFNGQQDPSRPDDVAAYMRSGIGTLPAGKEYLTDIKIKPHAVGNTVGNLIHVAYAENVEVGEFKVIGPAGLGYFLTEKNGHWGEIVYLGIAKGGAPNAIELGGELKRIDTSNRIHVHHIDNSAGHKHSEIVNAKLGTYDVLVEYCTDGGGSQNTENSPSASVRLQSYDATVRWNDLRNGKGHGVQVAVDDLPDGIDIRKPDTPRIEMYGNRVTGFDDEAFDFHHVKPGKSRNYPALEWVFCNNEYDGTTEGTPDAACESSVPTSDGIGHTGGDSPW